ncbi:MAG: hypothetical protein AB8I08_28540 [Sandaracinaceae bacterium]
MLVQLRTDLVASVEFFQVRTEVGSLDLPLQQTTGSLGIDDPVGGLYRVAEFSVPPGEREIRVTLFDRDAEFLARGVLRADIQGTSIVTVTITRDCVGVMCPGAEGNAGDTACLAGRCVDPRCSPETPSFCPPPRCATDAECATVDCVRAACLDGVGVCFEQPDDTRCARGEMCSAAVGCQPTPCSDTPEGCGDAGLNDAGPFDAGLTDAGVDAGGLDGGAEPHVFVQLAPDLSHSCGRTSRGEAHCWGGNLNGPLGDGTVTSSELPVRALLANVVELATGSNFSCAATVTGEAFCWGVNTNGQLGDSRTSWRWPREARRCALGRLLARCSAGATTRRGSWETAPTTTVWFPSRRWA